jgi:threonine dehydrogenase-like Zn-dependent dehydrogenase
MRAATWHGRRDIRVETVPDPGIQDPTDAIIRVTSTGLCGSDLHLYEMLGPFMSPGDILGHEPMGIVEEVGSALDGVESIAPGTRVVVPGNIACGRCFMCQRGLQSQCETTQVRSEEKGAALYGYTCLYGSVPGAQAQYLRVPHADYGLIPVRPGPPDDRFVYLSDVLPTAWQAVAYAEVPTDGSLVVIGLGPVGQMCCRVAMHRGIPRVIAIERVPDRIARARALGVEVIDLEAGEDPVAAIRAMTHGRGPDSVIDAVGMEAEGAPVTKAFQLATSYLPGRVAAPLMERLGVDRLPALHMAIDLVRRGGTVSIIGVYSGMVDPMPMMVLFDKQVRVHMGQVNVRRWLDDLLPLVEEGDPLGLEAFASDHLPLESAPGAYGRFQRKEGGTFKVLFDPWAQAGGDGAALAVGA